MTTDERQRSAHLAESLSGSFVWLSFRRAFRLHILPGEVLYRERDLLASANVTDPDAQAFLAWRRSVLLVIALLFVPLTLIRAWELIDGPRFSAAAQLVRGLPVLAEALFCITAFTQLRNWTRWQHQRRQLMLAWALYFIAPFVVYLFPFREAFDSERAMRIATEIGGVRVAGVRQHIPLVYGMVVGVQAMLVLAPKIISLMPGLIRAAIVSKLQFPGTTAPGWLMVLAAPLYALFAYVIMLLPYQITASWEFVAGNGMLLVAQLFIAWSGRSLTTPLSREESAKRIHAAWKSYIGLLACAGVLILLGMVSLVKQLSLGSLTVVSSALSFMSHVLLMTLVGTDTIVSGLHKATKRGPLTEAETLLLDDANQKLRQFCAGND